MRVVELQAHEISLCKELRLRALKDAPDAFADSLSAAENRPETYWRKMVASLTLPSKQRMFIAVDQGTYYGSVFALVDREQEDTGYVGGMWVDPVFRRKGIGQALLKEVFAWARKHEFHYLKLWVEDEPGPAKHFYQNAGFRETDNRDTSHEKIDKDIVEMVYEL